MKISSPLRWSIVVLALVLYSAAAHAQPSADVVRAQGIDALRASFQDVPRQAGPWVYWMFFENVMSREEITRQLEEMAAAGIAGAELRFLSLHGFSGLPGPWFDAEGWERLGQRRLEFLSPEFVAMLEHACHEARRLDLRLAMNLGMGWPPGGPWVTDEHRSKHLVVRSQVVPGPRELRGEQALPVPPGAMVFAWRIPPGSADDPTVEVASFRDLRGYVTPQNQLAWDVPDGSWLIGVFHYVPGGLCDKGNGPELDPGSREAVLFHLDHIFDRIEPRLASYFGSTLVEVASDSWEYERRGDARYWSPAIFAMFPEVAGYDVRERLYALLGYGPDRQRTLADIERVEREVIRKNFFITTTAYLHERGLRHRPQVRGRGLARDFFESYAEADVPEIEEEVFLPEAVWTARTLGKPIISAEAFTFLSGHGRNLELDGQQRSHEGPLADPRKQWETNPALLRWHANAHFARGVNRIQMHSFGYSPAGVPPPGWRIYAEVHLNRNVPWWPYMPSFSNWVARTQWVLQAGMHVADAVVYPVRGNPMEGPYNQNPDQPVTAFNSIDAATCYTLSRMADAAAESLYCCSQFVLIDDVRSLDEARHILTLLGNDTVLVCCHTLPEDWTGLRHAGDDAGECERLRAAFRDLAARGKIKDFREQGWREVLRQARSVSWLPATAQLTFQHRRVRGGEIYFLTNWGGSFSGEVSFPRKDLVPEIWDCDTGTTLPSGEYRLEPDRMMVPLRLAPHESALIVCTRSEPRLHAVRCEGGRVVADPAHTLQVWLESAGPCHVTLSDGRTAEFRVELPEPIQLEGPWQLVARPEQGVGLTAPLALELNQLVSWRSIPELRTFAGTVSYQMELDLPEDMLRGDLRLLLELGDVRELADIYLNGSHVGTSWFPPHCLDLTDDARSGKNTLLIHVPNVLKNHMEQGQYDHPSGLLGPVRIRPVGRVDLR